MEFLKAVYDAEGYGNSVAYIPIKVISTVSWGEPNTFWFCFDGIPKGSIVAVSTIGVRKEKSLFMQGYEEMIRKIKPKAVICYGEPFEEMKGKIIVVDYAQTNNYKKHYTLQAGENLIFQNIFDVCNKRAFGYVDIEKGRGSAGGGSSGGSNSSPKQSSQIIQRKKDDLPTNAKDSYNKYDKAGWKGTRQDQTPGTKAGSKWNNKPPQLPQTDNNGKPITYQEFDVNNKLPGSLRDAERFVRGSDGRTYYTPDHYNTFQEIID